MKVSVSEKLLLLEKKHNHKKNFIVRKKIYGYKKKQPWFLYLPRRDFLEFTVFQEFRGVYKRKLARNGFKKYRK